MNEFEMEQLELQEIVDASEELSEMDETIIIGSTWNDIKDKCNLLLRRLKK